jgi:hypothetical protein
MSTRIDIEVAQALLSQRAKEIAGLNREQRLERERKVKEEAAIKAGIDKGGQAIGGGAAALDARAQRFGLRSGVPEYYTPPKVAAQISNPLRVAVAYMTRTIAADATGYDRTIIDYEIFPPDGGSSVVLSVPLGFQDRYIGAPARIPQYPTDTLEVCLRSYFNDLLLLPVNDDTMIVVAAAKGKSIAQRALQFGYYSLTDQPIGANQTFTTLDEDEIPLTTKAAVVGAAGVREINVPAPLQSIYDSCLPSYVLTPGTVGPPITYAPSDPNYRPGTNYWPVTLPTLSPTFPISPGNIGTNKPYGLHEPGTDADFSVKWPTVRSTPSVFSFTTQAPTFTSGTVPSDPDEIKAFLQSQGVALPRQWISACQLDGTCSLDAFRFDVTAVEATDAVPYPDASVYRQKRNRENTYPVSIPDTDPGAYQYNPIALTAWDWGRPGYCRQQLLALGFTPADLQP